MDRKSKIESLLPGAWSKVLFVLSPALSTVLYTRFPDLPSSWLPTSEPEKFLIRILLSGSILLLGSVSLVITLVHHNRKIQSELSDLKKQNTEYFHQVSSLNTDKDTLQTLLDESKQTLNHLTGKHISLRQSHAELTEQNKEHIAKIDMLSSAADAFRDEMRQTRTLATEIQKELTKLKTDYNDLQQRYSESERLCNERKFLLEAKEKAIAELSKPIEPASASSPPDPPRRSFPGSRIPWDKY